MCFVVHTSLKRPCYTHPRNPGDALYGLVLNHMQVKGQKGDIFGKLRVRQPLPRGRKLPLDQPSGCAQVGCFGKRFHFSSSVPDNRDQVQPGSEIYSCFLRLLVPAVELSSMQGAVCWFPENCCQVCFRTLTTLSIKYKCRVS